MVVVQHRSRRKPTGRRYKKPYRSKRKHETGSNPTLTRIGRTDRKALRSKGGGIKQKLLLVDIANVFDPKTKQYKRAKIKTVLENPANRHYVRRNILTKGTIIDTELGRAKITSRPGQEGTVNAVLI